MILASEYVRFDFNSFRVSSPTNYVDFSMLALNVS